MEAEAPVMVCANTFVKVPRVTARLSLLLRAVELPLAWAAV